MFLELVCLPRCPPPCFGSSVMNLILTVGGQGGVGVRWLDFYDAYPNTSLVRSFNMVARYCRVAMQKVEPANDRRTDAEDSGVSDDVIREIVNHARSLSGEDDRVSVMESVHAIEGMSQAWLSSQLFSAHVVSASSVSADVIGEDCEQGLIHVHLEKPVTFEEGGEGYLRFGVTADAETKGIEAVNIAEVLDVETQRRNAQ